MDTDYGTVHTQQSVKGNTLILLIYFISFIVGFPGNCTVIWFTGYRWKKSVTTIWFLNLAIADTLFVIFIPFEITYILMGHYWPFGLFVCRIGSLMFNTGMYASIFFLTFISIDRYCLAFRRDICNKYRYRINIMVMIIISWIISILLSTPYMYFKNTNEKYRNNRDCLEDYHSDNNTYLLRRVVFCISLVMRYLVPSVVMLFCYCLLLFKHSLFLSKGQTYTIVIMITSFMVLWTPYNILYFIDVIGSHYYNADTIIDAAPISISLIFLSSSINPMIYMLVGRYVSFENYSMRESLKLILSEERDNQTNHENEIKMENIN
ncbi:G protein-coupled receptor family protein [Fowlpox virus]|uniref:G-protein coupled receptor homolog FPV021 n=2 Tax=Fowlpox virus TaxID=10261 RepID=V021_FOWPN|nr:G protein-coupled receptor gene family protein [Fowlpox virus]Q9J5I0.1 RecName: Full=G-protein coupled receptor homolog FPV021 [Fowlpox virus strain NVSL]UNS14205.1 ALPV-041 [Albatrosspox virus]WPD90973.1 G protein-coupled receptor family protein [Avipoxvirus sp.]CAE52567.1 putative G-protein-coupled receptor [Fowlpox virus isolate HP-438/Munich]AAF44365.1 ORF FPV021 G protein-coupled receptor gene family protein [Fowlpox virus]ART91455.1 G protein-coupled receptor family protein [Fowlpox 